MKIIQFCLLAALNAMLLTGCASGPTYARYSNSVPPIKDGEARIWFYRPNLFILGAGLQPAVMLNNVSVGKAQPGGFFYADRPPGIYEIKCTTEWANKCQVTLTTNSAKYVRLDIAPGIIAGHILPKEIEESKALKEMENCKLITSGGANNETEEKK
jgi:hypothetical protein